MNKTETAMILDVVKSMYVDEPCRICGHDLTSDDMATMVWAGYSQNNSSRSAHEECWLKNPAIDNVIPKGWVHQ